MKNIYVKFILAALAASFLSVAFAQQTSSAVIDSQAAQNFYVAERDILVRNANGNIYGAGNSITVAGNLIGDLLYAGRRMQIEGEIQGDVRAAGEIINVNNIISGDLLFAGAEVELGSAGEIGNDLTIAVGRSATLRGNIDGDVRLVLLGPGSSLDIFGTIKGDLSVANLGNGKITVHDGSLIEGDITHRSEEEDALVINNGASLSGQTFFIASEREGHFFSFIFSFIKELIAFVIIALFGFLLFRKYAPQLSYTGVTSALTAILFGGGFLILTVLVGAIFIGLLGFSWVGFFFLVAFAAALCIAGLLVPLLLGNILWRLAKKEDVINITNALIGGIVTAILSFIPFLSIVLVIIALYAIGVIVRKALIS